MAVGSDVCDTRPALPSLSLRWPEPHTGARHRDYPVGRSPDSTPSPLPPARPSAARNPSCLCVSAALVTWTATFLVLGRRGVSSVTASRRRRTFFSGFRHLLLLKRGISVLPLAAFDKCAPVPGPSRGSSADPSRRWGFPPLWMRLRGVSSSRFAARSSALCSSEGAVRLAVRLSEPVSDLPTELCLELSTTSRRIINTQKYKPNDYIQCVTYKF